VCVCPGVTLYTRAISFYTVHVKRCMYSYGKCGLESIFRLHGSL